MLVICSWTPFELQVCAASAATIACSKCIVLFEEALLAIVGKRRLVLTADLQTPVFCGESGGFWSVKWKPDVAVRMLPLIPLEDCAWKAQFFRILCRNMLVRGVHLDRFADTDAVTVEHCRTEVPIGHLGWRATRGLLMVDVNAELKLTNFATNMFWVYGANISRDPRYSSTASKIIMILRY